MSDNIAAQPENIAKTRRLFMSLLVRTLNEKSLQRPPFKFIQELIKNIISETRMLADLYTSQDLDTNRTLDKSAKIAFLQKLIIFLDGELDSPMKVDVKAARIVAGLDPDKTNQMLQALAYVLLSRKTGKSIQYIAASHGQSKSSRRDSTSTNVNEGPVSKQNVSIAVNSDSKRGDNNNKIKNIKRPPEQTSREVTPGSASSNRRQSDSRPGSSRISSSSSVQQDIVNTSAGTARKNSSASSNKAGTPNGNSFNIKPDENASFVSSITNKSSSKSSPGIRPTTSSKRPPRVITKEELVDSDSILRPSTTRPGTATNHNQVVNLNERKLNEHRKLVDNDPTLETKTIASAAASNDRESQMISKQDGITKSIVGERINDFEEVINKNELIKLMKYQDGLKKFDVNKGGKSLWNNQGPLVDDLSGSKKGVGEDTSNKITSSSSVFADQGSSILTQDHLDKISEQTDKMKQGLKILAQFIIPASKAVNFIFEDFDSIRTDYDRCLEMTSKNIEHHDSISNRPNSNTTTLAMARLNDLEVKIEKATEQVNRFKSQLVQNETIIRQKISSQASMT